LLLLLPVLAGCVSITYSPVQMDSPRPLGDGSPPMCESKVPVRNALAKEPKGPAATIILPPGNRCIFPVRADQMLSLTPLAIEEGQTYRITVPRNQVWYDASRCNVPPRGEPGNMIMNLLAHRKQHDTGWFALFAANVSRDGGTVHERIDVSAGKDFSVKAPGQLAFYPNDAIGVFREDFFYSNNNGQIWVQIERCAAACTSKSAD